MSSFDQGLGHLRSAAGQVAAGAVAVHRAMVFLASPIAEPWLRFTRWLKALTPTGLYARSLLIIILPMVFAQSVVALLFMERH